LWRFQASFRLFFFFLLFHASMMSDLIVDAYDVVRSESHPTSGRRREAPIILDLISVALVASHGGSCTFLIIDLFCTSFSSSSCIGMAVCSLFIKRDESLF
jgi:hypothetical protein